MLYTICFWVEVSTLLVCALCYSNFNLLRYKLFLPYLIIIVLYELGTIYKMFAINGSNSWIANIEFLFEYLFYSYFMISASSDRFQRKLLTLITGVGLLFTLIDIFFIQGMMRLCSIAILVQYGILIGIACRFFYIKMQEFEKNGSLLRDPDFWVHTGLLFFFLAGFMFFASYANMANKKIYSYMMLFRIITGIAILILYPCLSISFLCFRRTKKISY